MFERYLERINSIAEFLARTPHPDQTVDFLSAHISPIDEVVITYRAIVDSEGMIRCENIQGFSKDELITKTTFHLSENRPLTVAARSQKITWAEFETVLEEFPDFVSYEKHTPWQAILIIPVGLTRVYGFSFPTNHRRREGFNGYIEAISSILKVYEVAWDLKSKRGAQTYIDESEIQPLSSRQEQILEGIKRGLTNKEIALAIGYSESLVRHETIIIYRKLRVEGRHQLRESV